MILRELLSSFGLDFDQKGFEQANDSFDALADKASKFTGLLIGGALARSIAGFVADAVHMGDQVDATASKIGISTDALQELQFAAHLANVEATEFNKGLTRLGRSAAESLTGNKQAAAAFAKLGVNVKDASGKLRPVEELVGEVADGLSKISNEGEQAATAVDVFGIAGANLLPAMNKGAAGLEFGRKKARELGGVMNKEAVAAAAKLADSIDYLNYALQGFRNRVAAGVLPMVDFLVQKLTSAIAEFGKLTDGTRFVEGALIALGVTAAYVGTAMLLPFLPFLLQMLLVGAAVFALVAVLEDLYNLFKGNKSLIGAWIDSIFGIGSSAKFATEGIDLMTRALKGLLLVGTGVKNLFTGKFGELLYKQFFEDGEIKRRIDANGRVDGNTGMTDRRKPTGILSWLTMGGDLDRTAPTPAKVAEDARLAAKADAGQWYVKSETTFQINGATDPGSVADAVEDRMRARDEELRRQASDALTQAGR